MANVRLIELPEENRKEILDICENIHSQLIQRGIKLTNSEVYATIVYTFLKQTVETLKEMAYEREKAGDKEYIVEGELFERIILGISKTDTPECEDGPAPIARAGVLYKLAVKGDDDFTGTYEEE